MTAPKHIAILGAGPGGYVAAIRAAQLGARVTVIENQALGGVCLNWGCIPSKALLAVVELGEQVKKAADYGLTVEGPVGYDPVRMVSRKNRVVEGLAKGIATLFKIWNIEHINGTGELLDAKSLRVVKRDGTDLTIGADAIVIATGSSWPNLPLFPVDGKQIITSKEALDLGSIPKSLLIVGGGAEGCEFASLYSGLGTKVTLIEMMAQILPHEDEEIAAVQARELAKCGVEIRVGATVERVERQPGAVRAILKDGATIEVEQILVSVGRRFNSTGIGLEKAGVQVGQRGEILVNDRMETNVRGIYAIGDVVGQAMLAHVASAQGKVAVQNILGRASKISYNLIPAGIFTLPEIGRVGLTERQAREQVRAVGRNPDTDVRVGRFRYAALGRAQGGGNPTGLFKIISDAKTRTILGAHIIGAHAAELVHEAAMAMHLGATPAQMAEMIHAHPTLSEGLMEAAEDAEGMAIHAARKRA
jgi:dihydrolipoamide dehydrogenase